MSLAGTTHALPVRDTALWASRLARWVPAMMLSYGLLIWPIIYGRSPDTGPALQGIQNESSALSQIYFPILFVVTLFLWIATRYGRGSPVRSVTIALIGALVALCVASTLWSIAPDIALRRVILQVTIVSTLILSVQAADDPEGIVTRIFWTLVIIMGINAAKVAVTPPGPLGYEGVYPQKNGLGAAAALTVIVALAYLFTGRWQVRAVALGTIVVAMLLLVLSKSKTSLGLALMLPALSFAIAVVARATRISAAILVAVLLGLVIATYKLGVAAYLWDFPTVLGAIFGDPTLTTRTEIWDFALGMVERKPLLGYGFESFWQAGPESPSLREAPGFVARMPHAHNGYIDILLQVGSVGLALLVAIQFSAFHAASSALKSRFGLGWLCLTLMLFASLINFLESAWLRGFDMISMTFLTAVALATAIRERSA